MKNTKRIGDVTEAKILAALLAKGFIVLLPFSDNERYDLVIEKDNKFFKVQCKTVKMHNGSLRASASSSSCGRWKDYQGQIDYFGLYSPELDKCYLMPCKRTICLRVLDPLQKQG